MATSKTKVVGNNFDPYLVGLQWTSQGGTPLFTIGNFQITSNLTPPPKRNFQLGKFSDPLTLENLGSNIFVATEIVKNNNTIYLNLNQEDLLSYTLFGSFREFIRVELEQIQANWPGSLYVFNIYGSTSINTFNGYSFNSGTNLATFTVSTNAFYNYYGINFLQNAASYTGTSIPNSIKNLTIYYPEYVIDINGVSYPITSFVGATSMINGTCTFTVSGNPFNGVSNTTPFHIRPNDAYLERFFSSLDDFGRLLLNRNTIPKYTCNIHYEEQDENYFIFEKIRRFTWPVSDGYNLDKNTGAFVLYRKALLDIASNYDDYRTDLMRRVLVTESISYFELNPRLAGYYPINTTEKIDKLLNIYGREFDEVKKYIDGISFATNVSYNRQGNVPDNLIKDFAYYLGWDLLSPMGENDLLTDFLPTQSVYSGMSVGYSPAESEIEFWRRLVLNSAFLWKSKGTRKSIEFLFDFLNVPPSLISFNEYIYQAKQKINVATLQNILQYLNGSTSIDGLYVDADGYPKAPDDTFNMYFQKGGGWYRETAGENSQIDYYLGNNPHIGPYDGGQEYIDNFRCVIPGFGTGGSGSGNGGSSTNQSITITNEYVEFTNLFSNYFNGNANGYTGQIYADIVDTQNRPTDCSIVSGSVVDNPSTTPEYTVCGCPIPSGITKAILINVTKNPFKPISCSSTTVNATTIITSLQSCRAYTASAIDPITSTVQFNSNSPINGNFVLSTDLVPVACCQPATNNINFTWIESQNSNLGYCYYDDPCKSSTYLYLGNYLWADTTTPNSLIVTQSVPKNCCIYRGGIYDEITGKCEAPQ